MKEGDYIYLEGDEGMKRKWRTKRRDVAYSSGCPRYYGWHEGCQDTAGHGVKSGEEVLGGTPFILECCPANHLISTSQEFVTTACWSLYSPRSVVSRLCSHSRGDGHTQQVLSERPDERAVIPRIENRRFELPQNHIIFNES